MFKLIFAVLVFIIVMILGALCTPILLLEYVFDLLVVLIKKLRQRWRI